MADAPLRSGSDASLRFYCRTDLRGPPQEDIAINFGMRPCALPYTWDGEHMELEKV